jgi:hypothetical protein
VPGALATPVVRDITGDGRADVAFGTFDGVGVLVGVASRQLVPAAYPTFSLPNAVMRPLVVPGFPLGAGITPRDQILLFVASENVKGIVVPDLLGGPPRLVTDAPRPDITVGPITLGRFNESSSFPCPASVWAVDGASAITIFPLCTVDPSGNGVWNAAATGRVQVQLPPDVTLSKAAGGGVLVGDVNGDAHQDLLVKAGLKTFVAYGDGAGNFREKPTAGDPGAPNRVSALEVNVTNLGPQPVRSPLAVGDLNGDVMTDYVLATQVLVSQPDGKYRVVATKDRGAWDQAAIADFNGNGFLDIVVGSSSELDLTFFNGAGGGSFNPFTVPTTGTVDHFSVGDADGDLLPDLAFSMSTSSSSGAQALAIAWGRVGAALSAATAIGAFENIADVRTFNAGTGPSNIAVAFEPSSPAAGAIALLAGSGDRQPLAPLRLPEAQAANVPYATAVGRFSGAATPDIAAFAQFVPTKPRPNLGEEPTALWLGQSIGPAEFQTPAHGDPFSNDLVPSATNVGDRVGQRHSSLVATGDIDGDGIDELVVAAPVGVANASRGGLFVSRVKSVEGSVLLQPPADNGVPLPFLVSQEGQLAVEDVDGDGAADIVFLSGVLNNKGVSVARKLMVYWNQGGAFDSANVLTLSEDKDSPEGFAFLRDRAAGQRSLAYASGGAIVVAHIASRAVESRSVAYQSSAASSNVAPLTGVASGDFNGDGVEDLAVAELSNLVILRGEPVLK